MTPHRTKCAWTTSFVFQVGTSGEDTLGHWALICVRAGLYCGCCLPPSLGWTFSSNPPTVPLSSRLPPSPLTLFFPVLRMELGAFHRQGKGSATERPHPSCPTVFFPLCNPWLFIISVLWRGWNVGLEKSRVESQVRDAACPLPILTACLASLRPQTCGNACLLISWACDRRPCDLAGGR